MELEEFVSETLRQIVAGVKKAQAGEDGMLVNAGGFPSSGHIVNTNVGTFTRVDFDVAVTAENTSGGKGSLQVWSLGGGEIGKQSRSHTASRIQFSVGVRIPEGDQERVEARRREYERASRDADHGSWMT